MTQLERQIRATQHRLWTNRWLHAACRCVAIAGCIYAAVVLVQRLYDVPIPLFGIGVALGGGALLASAGWTLVTREGAAYAAAKLDAAAGLRERLSSGHYCTGSDDPFAQAVLADAERISSTLTVRQYVRLAVPPPLAFAGVSVVLAGLMFLLTPGLLQGAADSAPNAQEQLVAQVKVAVKRELDAVRQMAEGSPALEDLQEDLEGFDRKIGADLRRPTDVRHEAVKKIDKLADAVKGKRDRPEYNTAREMRKMLRGLKVPSSSEAPTQKLARALQQGDFKTAQEEIKALRETLASLKSEEDRELVAKMSKQLDELAKQLDQLSKKRPAEQKLTQAGLSQEDVQRLLEELKKEDLDQLKKQLEERGMSQEQIEKLVKQLQQQQTAGSVARKLARAMQKAGQGAGSGQTGEALAGLTMAEAELSGLEQLEQEMNQLDAVLAELQNARGGLDGCKPGQ